MPPSCNQVCPICPLMSTALCASPWSLPVLHTLTVLWTHLTSSVAEERDELPLLWILWLLKSMWVPNYVSVHCVWWTQFEWKRLSRSQRERTNICYNTVFGHPLQSSSSELDFNINTSFIQLCRKIVWPTQEKVSWPLSDTSVLWNTVVHELCERRRARLSQPSRVLRSQKW